MTGKGQQQSFVSLSLDRLDPAISGRPDSAENHGDGLSARPAMPSRIKPARKQLLPKNLSA